MRLAIVDQAKTLPDWQTHLRNLSQKGPPAAVATDEATLNGIREAALRWPNRIDSKRLSECGQLIAKPSGTTAPS